MSKPNVIAKIQYIECDNSRRVFYSSNSKDDYHTMKEVIYRRYDENTNMTYPMRSKDDN